MSADNITGQVGRVYVMDPDESWRFIQVEELTEGMLRVTEPFGRNVKTLHSCPARELSSGNILTPSVSSSLLQDHL